MVVDTVWSLDYRKCIHCYKCIEICTSVSLQDDDGSLGMLIFDEDGDVKFNGDTYGCSCHHCKGIIDGKEIKGYVCQHFCPTGAMEIKRY